MKCPAQEGTPHFRMKFFQDFRSEMSLVLLIIFTPFAIGCKTYYKVTPATATPAEITEWINLDKYFIVHTPSAAWHLDSVRLDQAQENLMGNVEMLPAEHLSYETTRPEKLTRYKPKYAEPNYEVHIYTSKNVVVNTGPLTIPIPAITKIEIYDKAVGATLVSHLAGVVGVGAGIFGLVLVIAAATKSSCPFVYINGENGYQFVGEMFGGAIRANLERDDYMPLPGFTPFNSEYKLKITNELKERQYTNLAELKVVQHQANSRVLLDEYGKPQIVTNPVSPVLVVSDNMINNRSAVMTVDDQWILFNEDPSINRDMSNITMTFDRPVEAKTGKLVIQAKNSLWLDYIYGKLTEQYGTYYNAYEDQQRNAPAGRNATWAREQGVTLAVYLREGNTWTYVDDFPVLGPLATREFVMPIDLTRVAGDDVTIRLSCGFMFWEIDYAGMDYTPDEPLSMITVKPLSATDELGRDVRESLMEIDTEYLEQPIIGNEAIITYTVPPSLPEMKQTIFLHSSGYYEYIREYTTAPNLKFVKTFWKPGAFTRFSKEMYADQVRRQGLLTKETMSGN